MTHEIRGVDVQKYPYYVNKLRQNVGLETWKGRQIVTSQTAPTKWPPYDPEPKPPHENFLRTPLMLTAVTSVSEVIVIFLQLIVFANTAAFFYSLLGLASHCFWEGDSGEEISTRWRCVEKINHSRDSWLLLKAYKPAFHIYRAILESFFYAYSAIVDSFVIVSLCLEKHFRNITVDQHATFVPDYANVLVKVVAIFGVINRVHTTFFVTPQLRIC